VRHYHPQYYSDEDRSDGGYYSSESPEDTDSERDDYRDRGHRHGHYIPDDLGAAHVPDSESSSEGGVPGSESETETDEYSDRYAPEEYESESAYDRDDRDSYGDPYGDWDEYDDDDYGEYDGMFMRPVHTFPDFRVFISPSSQTATPPIIITRSGLLRSSTAKLVSLGVSQNCPKCTFIRFASIKFPPLTMNGSVSNFVISLDRGAHFSEEQLRQIRSKCQFPGCPACRQA